MPDRLDDQSPPPDWEFYRRLLKIQPLANWFVGKRGLGHIADQIVDEALGIALDLPQDRRPTKDAPEGLVKAWFLNVVRNCCLNASRKERCHRGKHALLFALMQSAQPQVSVESIDLRRAVESLPAQSRNLVERFFYRDLGLDEIAAMDRCSPRTVRRRLAEIVNAVRAALVG